MINKPNDKERVCVCVCDNIRSRPDTLCSLRRGAVKHFLQQFITRAVSQADPALILPVRGNVAASVISPSLECNVNTTTAVTCAERRDAAAPSHLLKPTGGPSAPLPASWKASVRRGTVSTLVLMNRWPALALLCQRPPSSSIKLRRRERPICR